MKMSSYLRVAALGLFVLLFASVKVALSAPSSATRNPRPPLVLRRAHGPHQRDWRIEETPGDIGSNVVTRRFTQLQSGLNAEDKALGWTDASEEIEIHADGSAHATKTRHKIVFQPNINRIGAVHLSTADQKDLRSRIAGLAYYDFKAKKSVLIAELKDSVGQLVGTNQVIYRDAFVEFKADVRYTVTKAGLEQDIILRERPPLPEEFGLNPASTWLEVWTEFINPPKPILRQVIRKGWKKSTVDDILDFGEMKIGPGTAFGIGGAPQKRQGISVQKHWETIDKRQFLIEEVSFRWLASQLRALPAQPGNAKPNINLKRREASNLRVPPVIQQAKQDRSQRIQVASLEEPKTGVVIDYAIVDAVTDFTFKSGETYYVTGPVSLDGTTTIEGGAVIKFDIGGELNFLGAVRCLTADYHPAIFTAKDDDSVGEVIVGSTGSPTGYYADTAIVLNSAADLRHIRVSYASEAVYSPLGVAVWHSQFLHCGRGIHAEYSSFDALNVLMYDVRTNFFGSFYHGNVQHLTSHHADMLAGDWNYYPGEGCAAPPSSTLGVVNSLMVQINASSIVAVNGANNNSYSEDNSVFVTQANGDHYLSPNNTTDHDAGTTAINWHLLQDLRTKTTSAPEMFANGASVATNLLVEPSVDRDTNAPDLGYHYDPIDYIASSITVLGDLSLTNGAIVALTGNGVTFDWEDASAAAPRLRSSGTALAMNRFVECGAVQENGGPCNRLITITDNLPSATTLSTGLNVDCKFTEFVKVGSSASSSIIFPTRGGMSGIYKFRDCQFAGGEVQLGSVDANWSETQVLVTNCLFENAGLKINIRATGLQCAVGNTLFRRGSVTFDVVNTNNVARSIACYNNVFDCTSIAQSVGTNLLHDYNGYVTNYDRLGVAAHDVVLGGIPFEAGFLGNFYYPENLLFVDAGSRSASDLTLADYTTVATQTQEAGTQVNLGFHYVALDENGQPVDANANGVPDYIEHQSSWNNAPSFVLSTNEIAAPNYTSLIVVSNFATQISAGDAGQTVAFIVSSTNTNFFVIQPAIDASGTLTYQLVESAFGTNSLAVQLRDNGGIENGGEDTSATQTFSIIAKNTGPSPQSDSFTCLEDTVLFISSPGVLSNDADGDGDSLTVTLTSAPLHGAVVLNTDGSFTYTPATNFFGNDSFVYHVSDGYHVGTNAAVNVTVSPVNDPPSFVLATNRLVVQTTAGLTVRSNFALAISAGPNEMQALQFVLVTSNTNAFQTQPAISTNGVLSFSPANATSTNSITVALMDDGGTANGGGNTSSSQTFDILVQFNNPPSAVSDSYSTLEDSVLTVGASGVLANDSDVESTNLTVHLVGGAAHGSVELNSNGAFTYTPNSNFSGTDSFTYTANDGQCDGNVATVAITVTAVNDAPSFTIATNIVLIAQNAGLQNLSNFVSNISAGPPNETNQALQFSLSITDSAFFSIQPSLSESGNLSFKVMPGVTGTNTFTITLTDDGGINNGATNSFTRVVMIQSAATTLLPGVVAFWPGEGNANDLIGGNNGSLFGGASFVAGESGQCFSFNGTNAYVNFGNSIGNFGTNDFSVDFWLRTTSTASQACLGKRPICNVSSFFSVRMSPGAFGAEWCDATGAINTAIGITNVYTNGIFHHIAFVRRGKTNDLYFDGALAGTKVTTGVANLTNSVGFVLGTNVCIGADGTKSFKGELDEIELFNRALSATEVQYMRDLGPATKVPVANTAPSFSLLTNHVFCLQSAGFQTITNFAYNISAGTSNDALQTLTFIVSVTNSSFFASAPTLEPSGRLTFQVATNVVGTNYVTISLKDNGGTAFGGIDTSSPQVVSIAAQIRASPPVILPTSGIYTNPAVVTLSNALSEAQNFYSTDATHWRLFTNNFVLVTNCTIFGQTFADGYYPSLLTTNTYLFADSDGDSIPDAQEIQNGSDRLDYFNGVLPQLAIVSGDGQLGLCKAFVAQPVVVQVSSSTGAPLPNAPVTFAVSSGNAQVSQATNATLSQGITTRSAADGKAYVWVYLPQATTSTNLITASASVGSNSVQVVFTIVEKLRTPVLSPPGGSYAVTQPVRCAIASLGTTVHYTTNGQEPTEADPVFPVGGTVFVDSTFVKARAWKSGSATSDVRTATYVRAGQVAAGDNHTLVLKVDGTVWATGLNNAGQLGNGTQLNQSNLVAVTDIDGNVISNVTAIAAGSDFSLAISNGYVYAWGSQAWGRLGNGIINNNSVNQKNPVRVLNISNIVAVAAGSAFGLALESNGTVWGWGYNASGQLGDNTVVYRAVAAKVLDATLHLPLTNTWTQILAIAAGDTHALAIANNTVLAWGSAPGNGWNDPALLAMVGSHALTTAFDLGKTNALGTPTSIAAGSGYSLFTLDDGSLWGWGLNSNGQLGDGRTKTATIIGYNSSTDDLGPVPIAPAGSSQLIACGAKHSLSVKPDGSCTAWGINTWGQLGNGTLVQSNSPVPVDGGSKIVAVAGGTDHSVAITSEGNIIVWGRHQLGQLGTGKLDYRAYPDVVSGLSNITAIAAGNIHNLAVDWKGSVYSWGDNTLGKLGDGTTVLRSSPVLIPGLTNVASVAAGDDFSLVISNGVSYGFGRDYEGQLGDGRLYVLPATPTPVRMLKPQNAITNAAGALHGLALSNGIVWAWGANTHGQLGIASGSIGTPSIVTNLSGVSVIAAGYNHSLAISNGYVWAWGYNLYGQIGNSASGAAADAHLPVRVTNLTQVTAIAGGGNHSLAVSNGLVYAWGLNTSGQLGDGTTTARIVPTLVTNLSSISAVAGGASHSLALASDGTVWAWGLNSRGQLGNGTLVNSKVPVRVAGLPTIIAIEAGDTHSLALGADGKVYAWGDELYYGQLGDGNIGYLQRPIVLQTDRAGFENAPALSVLVSDAQTVYEDELLGIEGVSIGGANTDGVSVRVSLSVTNGLLTLSQTNAIAIVNGTNGASSNLTFTADLNDANSALVTLSYLGRTNFYGTDRLIITVDDEGSGAVGHLIAASNALSITVTGVNDAPIASADTYTIDEDAVLTVEAPGVLANDLDVEAESLAVSTLMTEPSHGTVILNPDGSFVYTPATNFNGTDSFTYVPNDGVDDGPPALVTITIQPTVDLVELSAPASFEIFEDTAVQLSAVQVNNVDGSNPILQVKFSSTAGAVNFGITNGLNFIFGDNGLGTNVVVEGDYQALTNALLHLSFIPVSNFFGEDSLSIELLTSGQSVASNSATITVQPVNDAPSFIAGTNIVIFANSGAQLFPQWANNVSTGAPNESEQALTFIVTSDNSSLFTSAPLIDRDGNLSFETANNAFGTASVAIYVQDDGGTDNGGVDRSPSKIFTITVSNAPVVQITSPTNNSIFLASGPTNIVITASAYEPGGDIDHVTFFANDIEIGSATTPLSFLWTNVSPGRYTLTARAFDTNNASRVSHSVSITVDVDTDDDRIGDTWETNHGFDPNNAADALTDKDNDGLTNLEEYRLETDPNDADTDYDGRTDFQEISDGTDPLNAGSVVHVPLATWRFNESGWTGESAQSPFVATNVVISPSWSSNSAHFGNSSVLIYRDCETNGVANVNSDNGTIQFWFRPTWTSSAITNGTGPGQDATFIEFGSESFGEWIALQVDQTGNEVTFKAHGTNGSVSQLVSSVRWLSNEWHLISVTYSVTNAFLYIDGAAAATNGTELQQHRLSPQARAVGFAIGNNHSGAAAVFGDIDELQTFNYPLRSDQVIDYYMRIISIDTDGDGLADVEESSAGTLVNTVDSDADGRTDFQEIEEGTDPRNNQSFRAVRLAAWNFDDGDFFGNHGQRPTALTNVTVSPGFFGTAAHFGDNGPMLGYRATEVNGSQNLCFVDGSISMWLKPGWDTGNGTNSISRDNVLLEAGDLMGTNDWISLSISNGNTVVLASRAGGTAVTNINTPMSFTMTNWHQITVTYTATNTSLYVNGAPAQTNGAGTGFVRSTELGSSTFHLGSRIDGSASADCAIDQLETYNYVRSAEDILTDYEKSKNSQ